MSLLDVFNPTDAQLAAAKRQEGRSKTHLHLFAEGNKDERKRELHRLRKIRFHARHPGLYSDIKKLGHWVALNPQRAAEAKRRWAQENKDRINRAAREYRARKRAAA